MSKKKTERQQLIGTALSTFVAKDPAYWTQDGLPLMEAVHHLTGDNTITRDEVTAAYPGFNRDNLDLGEANVVSAGSKEEKQRAAQHTGKVDQATGDVVSDQITAAPGVEIQSGETRPDDVSNTQTDLSSVGDHRDTMESESKTEDKNTGVHGLNGVSPQREDLLHGGVKSVLGQHLDPISIANSKPIQEAKKKFLSNGAEFDSSLAEQLVDEEGPESLTAEEMQALLDGYTEQMEDLQQRINTGRDHVRLLERELVKLDTEQETITRRMNKLSPRDPSGLAIQAYLNRQNEVRDERAKGASAVDLSTLRKSPLDESLARTKKNARPAIPRKGATD